jgi:hypothetical protein
MKEWGRLDSSAEVRERPLSRDPGRLLLLSGAALLFVGSLMPWVSAFSDQVGRVAWTGVDGRGDGGILMFLGVLLGAFALWGRSAVEAWEPVRFVPLGLAVLVVGDYVIAFRETSHLIEEGVGTGRLEAGIYVVGVGVLLVVPGAILGFLRARSDR